MKKLIIPTIVTAIMFLTGCGNDWELTKKSFVSNYGDLPRKVKVYDSLSKEVLWEYTGNIYLDDRSKPGNITVIYHDRRNIIRKNDFIGQHIAVTLEEIDN